MTTDIHTHLGYNRMSINEVTLENLVDHVDLLVARMDTFGVDHSVLTALNPRISNDLYLRAVEIYPDRLSCACSIIPRPIDYARQMTKQYAEAGCKALVLDENHYYPDDPAVLGLIRSAIDEGLAIYFHSEEMKMENSSLVDRASLMYPDGKFVVLHMGGLFGFPRLIPLMGRPNIWLDTSTTLIKLVESPLRVYLDALVQDIGVRKLVFGSGHHTEYPDLQATLNMIDLNVETSRIIKKENAWLILGIDFS
ncbi:MAG: amidohydrolase family protein [Candidatus Thorarchaeota archaeon]|jgi:predicted TIM-barrel fold metal-dependent hydrolase